MTQSLTEKLDALDRKAKEATPGPWLEDDGNVFSAPISNANYQARSLARREGRPQPPRGYDGAIAKCEQDLPNFTADAAFIASANPAVVAALVAVARESLAVRRYIGGFPNAVPVAREFDSALSALDAALGGE